MQILAGAAMGVDSSDTVVTVDTEAIPQNCSTQSPMTGVSGDSSHVIIATAADIASGAMVSNVKRAVARPMREPMPSAVPPSRARLAARAGFQSPKTSDSEYAKRMLIQSRPAFLITVNAATTDSAQCCCRV